MKVEAFITSEAGVWYGVVAVNNEIPFRADRKFKTHNDAMAYAEGARDAIVNALAAGLKQAEEKEEADEKG